MDTKEDIVNGLLKAVKERLTLDGRNRVFNEGKKLQSEFMKERSETEAFTKEFLIEKILNVLGLEKLPEKSFETPQGHRSVDYRIKSKRGMFLVEAKPLNTDLFEKGKDGGVNQIKGLFKLGEVERNYDFGVATDGLRWVFIDKTGKIVDDLNLEKDFEKIKEFLVSEEKLISPKTEEEISKKFYDWYNALLHGGKYKDYKNKIKTISEEDCLVNNILGVKELKEKEQVAQVIVDRLIFVKFLQSKRIIGDDILKGLSELSEEYLNAKLRLLFFAVFNTPLDERLNVGETFKNLPYLNGSLFTRTEVEKRYPDYRIKAEILKKVIEFLDAFKFVHKEGLENAALDPEILGYIFERAMTATDRKGTGAYYTPKPITRYISENTIYPYLLDRVNNFLKKEKGYKESELISDVKKILILPSTTLEEIRDKILEELKVLDNACGSGAFLLSAANIIFDLSRKIDDKLNLKNSDASLKKRILIKNIYGVDINPNAVEIAKLRLWLWLVDSYSADYVEPLPNIEYNLRVGNSLIGYVDISKFKESKLTLNDYFENTEKSSLFHSLHNRGDLISRYKNLRGDEAKEAKEKITEIDKQIKRLLDANLFKEIQHQRIKISEGEFRQLNPFYWGFEFYDVFNLDKPKEEQGFDVVIGNPPYVRADAQDTDYQRHRELMERIGEYETLYEKWDLFTAFIEKSLKLLNKGGMFSYIVSSSFNTSKFADKSKTFILENYHLKQIDFFKNITVFRGIGVENVILLVKNSAEKAKTRRILHVNLFENVEELEPSRDLNKIFRISPEIDFGDALIDTELLGNICFISYGLRPNSDERYWKGEFKKEDLISDVPTRINTKPYVEAKYIGRYKINIIKYLEWDTERSPKKLARPTFPELYEPHKIIRGATVDGTYDEKGLVCNHSINVMVKYADLKSVSNRSIKNSIKKWTGKARKELEEISRNFDLKYILTILNSKFAKFYLNTIRRHRIEYYFYPDDFKRLPIKKISLSSQRPFVTLCDYMLFLNKTEELRKSEKELIEFIDRQIIDSLVYELYFKEGLKTNLIDLVSKHLGNISSPELDDMMKLIAIRISYDRLKSDPKIQEEIEKIKSHEWVKVIEESKTQG